MKGKTLILGGTGLIGSALIRHCEQNCFSFLAPSRDECDLTDRAAVREYLMNVRPEVVIMAVGVVGGIAQNLKTPADFLFQNTNFLANVLPECISTGVLKFIFFGSSCMYPVNCTQPYEEKMLFDGKPEQTSISYAVSKLWGVEACLTVNRQYDHIQCIPVIPSSVYGPNDDFGKESSHVLSALINRFHHAKEHDLPEVQIWGTGAPLRDFVYSDDVAGGVYSLLNANLPRNRAFNIGSGEEISIYGLAKLIASVVGFNGSINFDSSKPDGAARKILDVSFLGNLGWSPQVDLETGIKRLHQWYLNHDAKNKH